MNKEHQYLIETDKELQEHPAATICLFLLCCAAVLYSAGRGA